MDSVIDIDSDDGGEAVEDSKAENSVAAAALEAEPARDHLLCQLHVPPNSGLKPQLVGDVCLWLECVVCEVPCGGCEIHICRHPGGTAEDTICIPVDSVSSAQVEADGPTVLPSMSPPLVAVGFMDDFLASVGSVVHYPEDKSGGDAAARPVRPFSTIALTTWPDVVRPMLATLRTWLPCVTLYGPRSLGLTEQVTLQLRGIVMEGRDVGLLDDDRWLNDAVLDFFLRLAVEVAVPDELQEKLYVAKTQFFTRLTACSAASGEKGWENVKTWTRSVTGGISSQSYIVYPVNDANCHWWVAIVCHPHRAMELGGMSPAGGAMSDDKPRIVCLDPAYQPLPKDGPLEFMKGYLRRELFNNPTELASGADDMTAQVQRWKAAVNGLKKMEAIVPEVPMQMNAFDCGVYVLEYLVYLLRHPGVFSQLGLESHQQWFSQALVTHRRQRMREIIARLQKEAEATGEGDVVALLRNEGVRAAVVQGLTDEPVLEEDPHTAALMEALRDRSDQRHESGQEESTAAREGMLAASKFRQLFEFDDNSTDDYDGGENAQKRQRSS